MYSYFISLKVGILYSYYVYCLIFIYNISLSILPDIIKRILILFVKFQLNKLQTALNVGVLLGDDSPF